MVRKLKGRGNNGEICYAGKLKFILSSHVSGGSLELIETE
jgi:hypothetical protein